MQSFYWYDLETTGTDPKWDRIVQFAGYRTDLALNPVGDELCTYVRLADDVLPNPDAALVTGILPATLASEGISEWQALHRINGLFAQPGTCVAGYNSLRFDDEFIRYGLYRNLHDPYAREWQQGNSRWDLIDLVRATGALRREGINWPQDDEGLPVYRLELLTQANNLEHGQAHDALSDVRATVAMARLVMQRQPKLFDYYLNQSNKAAVRALLEPFGARPILHVSGMYPREQYCCAPVVSLGRHPRNANSVIVADLSRDITPLLDWSTEELRANLFAKEAQLRPGLKEVRINRCPFVASMNVLSAENLARLPFSVAAIKERHQALCAGADGVRTAAKVVQVYADQRPPASIDVDAALYDAFVGDEDRQRCLSLQQELREQRWVDMDFTDQRLVKLAQRLKLRSFTELCTTAELEQWQHAVARKLNTQNAPWLTLTALQQRLAELRRSLGAEQTQALGIVEALEQHAQALARRYPPSDPGASAAAANRESD